MSKYPEDSQNQSQTFQKMSVFKQHLVKMKPDQIETTRNLLSAISHIYLTHTRISNLASELGQISLAEPKCTETDLKNSQI